MPRSPIPPSVVQFPAVNRQTFLAGLLVAVAAHVALFLPLPHLITAGAALIIIQPIEPSIGREYIGRVFAVCVLGGMGSLQGTLIAALLLGTAESITSTFVGPSWAPAIGFGILLLTLAFKPEGLISRK